MRSWGLMRAVKAAKLAVEPALAGEGGESEDARAEAGDGEDGNALGLDVDAPDLGVEVEGGKGTVLAEDLELVDDLVSCANVGKLRSAPPPRRRAPTVLNLTTIVTSTGETLRVPGKEQNYEPRSLGSQAAKGGRRTCW